VLVQHCGDIGFLDVGTGDDPGHTTAAMRRVAVSPPV
jgi:hypothetical protein